MRKGLLCLIAGLAIVTVPPSPAAAQHDGGGGGGGGGGAGCGDVFGDLVHILRADTGQPILAQRWIEMPRGESGYGWGYCPIAVDATGAPLPFAVLSCDVAESALGSVVPVDYFGRLSGGRTKERNHRMHFNEVISNIKMAGSVGLDETGRLRLGYECVNVLECVEWSAIDSPMENMALYTRLMKYGHLQTDPLEEDMWAHGDPAAGIQYHPALGPEDWTKFQPSVLFLLPGVGAPAVCFNPDYDEDAPAAGTYDLACADPESLSSEDFVTAAAALGGAANKTGQITVDLVQYMNRILKITKNTEASASTMDRLPALIRDCWSPTEDPDGYGEGSQDDPPYLDLVDCQTDPPGPEDGNLALFPDALEEFVDFSQALYDRAAWRNTFVNVVGPVPANNGSNTLRPWVEVSGVSILEWLEFTNGPQEQPLAALTGFVAASSDTLRSIEFVHNYSVPEDLDWDFVPSGTDAKFKLKAK